jgi:hypothetical protein
MLVAGLGPQRPGEGHHTVLDRHDDALGVGQRELVEDLADVVDDVGVGAQEDADQVTAAHDADELAVLVDHRQPPDVVRVHQPRRGGNGRVGPDGDGRGRHQRAGGQAHVRLLAEPPAPADGARQPGLPGGFVLRGEQVGLSDDARHLPAHHQHLHAADPALGQQPVDVLERGDPVHGRYRGRHHIADPARPPAVPGSVVVDRGGACRARCLLVQVLLHRVQRAVHVLAGGPAVQGLVVCGAEVAEHGIEVNV